MLTFSIEAVRAVIARGIADADANGGFRDPHGGHSDIDNCKPGLWLVGDHGVYLCSNGKLAGARPLVVYAQECDPTQNDDWFEIKRVTFGGDDGVDFLDAIELGRLMSATPDATHVRISMDDNAMTIDLIRV
jgi:hypothetical protein